MVLPLLFLARLRGADVGPHSNRAVGQVWAWPRGWWEKSSLPLRCPLQMDPNGYSNVTWLRGG